jgi:transmembrane sensor
LKENEDHIIDLLVKYHTKEANSQERADIETWLKLSEENHKLGNDIQIILEKAKHQQVNYQYNTDKAWQKVQSRLTDKGKLVDLKSSTSAWQWSLRIAASLLLIISIVYISQPWLRPAKIEFSVASTDSTLTDTLPDGTSVFLNKNTSLTHVTDKKTKQQRVQLNGEAYFEMASSTEKNFIIETSGIYVQDIGTKFNLRSYLDEEEISVVVEEGIVKLFSDDDEGIHVLAGETGYYNKIEQRFYKQEVLDVNALAYKTKVFVFNNTPLAVIISSLNQVYDLPIQLSGNIQSCQVTVSFKDEPIESIVDILAETLGLIVHINPGEIILEGKGCGL